MATKNEILAQLYAIKAGLSIISQEKDKIFGAEKKLNKIQKIEYNAYIRKTDEGEETYSPSHRERALGLRGALMGLACALRRCC